MSESFHFYRLADGVEDVLVGKGAIWQFLHLLQFGLGVVEGETAEGGEEAGYHASAEWMIGYMMRTLRVSCFVPRYSRTFSLASS